MSYFRFLHPVSDALVLPRQPVHNPCIIDMIPQSKTIFQTFPVFLYKDNTFPDCDLDSLRLPEFAIDFMSSLWDNKSILPGVIQP